MISLIHEGIVLLLSQTIIRDHMRGRLRVIRTLCGSEVLVQSHYSWNKDGLYPIRVRWALDSVHQRF